MIVDLIESVVKLGRGIKGQLDTVSELDEEIRQLENKIERIASTLEQYREHIQKSNNPALEATLFNLYQTMNTFSRSVNAEQGENKVKKFFKAGDYTEEYDKIRVDLDGAINELMLVLSLENQAGSSASTSLPTTTIRQVVAAPGSTIQGNVSHTTEHGLATPQVNLNVGMSSTQEAVGAATQLLQQVTREQDKLSRLQRSNVEMDVTVAAGGSTITGNVDSRIQQAQPGALTIGSGTSQAQAAAAQGMFPPPAHDDKGKGKEADGAAASPKQQQAAGAAPG